MIDGKTQLTGVIADPVEHSLSPPMHNACYAALKLNFVYVAMRVRSEALRQAIEGLKALNFRGFNVSVPHKQTIVQLLDELDDFAANCNAVNTVVNDGLLKGYNTDGPGALLAAEEAGVDFSRTVVVGAGGAASAIAYAFAKEGALVHVLNRTGEKAGALAERLKKHGLSVKGGGLDRLKKALDSATFLVQATRVGLGKNESIVPKELLNPSLAMLDVVYHPLETRLIKDAKARGCKAITGERMLLHQAVLANEKWIRQKPDFSAMEKALYEALKK